ncbi:MAG: general secretion pathway protein GspB [Nevskiaceae bacterium]|jgi:general secretion pathway protein B|nr:general secretion pathway protein GspB [Nevskiaceae bacterium]
MSFILDALKKSESERARQSGPTLVNPRIVPSRRGLPTWVIALGAILLANLIVLAVMLMRSTPRDAAVVAAPPPAAATVAAVATPPATATPATPAPAPAPPPAAPPPAPIAAATRPEPAIALPPPALPPTATAPPLDETPSPPPTGRLIAPVDSTLVASAALEATPEPTVTAPPPPPPPDASGLPTAEDLRLSGISLPPLNMALHAFDAAPANRYVLLNGQKLGEGQSTADGVRIEQITVDGAVLRWREQRFMLTPGD